MRHKKNKHTKAILKTGLTVLAALPWLAASLPAHAQAFNIGISTGTISNNGDTYTDAPTTGGQTGPVDEVTIDQTGLYQFTLLGGDGGGNSGSNDKGGNGLSVTGDVSLTQGELLYVIAGQAGENSNGGGGGGGNGGGGGGGYTGGGGGGGNSGSGTGGNGGDYAISDAISLSYGQNLTGENGDGSVTISLVPNASAAPEPSQMAVLALIGLGLTGLLWHARRRAV